MNIGKMRHIVHLQKPSNTVNAGGTPVEIWLPFATLRAERLSSDLSETVADAGAEDRQLIRFRTRYVAKVTPDMRLHFDGDNFNIKRLQVQGNNQFLEIEAVQVGG